jgi:O-antigen/teichoic acid export membrane protein
VFYNLLGLGLPLLLGLFLIPILIRNIGLLNFGMLSIVWALTGYASLFDLGIGRALTQIIAVKRAGAQTADIGPLVTTALSVSILVGCLGAAVLGLAAPLIVTGVLRVPLQIEQDMTVALCLAAACIPLVVGTTALRGVLEGMLRFDLANALRIPIGVLTFVGPLLVSLVTSSIAWSTASLLLMRVLMFVAHLVCVNVAVAGDVTSRRPELRLVSSVLRFGGWITVSNVISPLMTSADRFLVSGVLGASLVAYYTTPWEMITKLLVVSGAVATVFFPYVAASLTRGDRRVVRMSDRAMTAMFAIIFPICIIGIVFAQPLLERWLGADIGEKSVIIAQWLFVGVVANSVASIPFAIIQGAGRADLTAKVHLAEVPVYAVVLYLCLQTYGIDGAAIAWTVRIVLDLVVMLVVAASLLRERSTPPHETVASGLGLLPTAAILIGLLIAASYTALTPPPMLAVTLLLAAGAVEVFAIVHALKRDPFTPR